MVPGGKDAGGHGVPPAVDPDAPGFVCDVPEELPAEFVESEFAKLEFEPEFAEPQFDGPEFVAVGSAPGFAVVGLEPGFEVAGFVKPAVPGALPGSVPHGDPLGIVPGLFVVSGFTVEGDVLVPDVAGAGEFDPGMLPGEVAFGDDPFRRLCGDVRSCLWCRRWCRRCRGLGWRSGRDRRTLGHRPTRTATEYE